MLGDIANNEGDNNFEPCESMEFDSHQDAYSFHLKYAKLIGFGITKKSSLRLMSKFYTQEFGTIDGC